jgi:hypothetical protein
VILALPLWLRNQRTSGTCASTSAQTVRGGRWWADFILGGVTLAVRRTDAVSSACAWCLLILASSTDIPLAALVDAHSGFKSADWARSATARSCCGRACELLPCRTGLKHSALRSVRASNCLECATRTVRACACECAGVTFQILSSGATLQCSTGGCS